MTVTELEILESLDFDNAVTCEWCEVHHIEPLAAAVYLRRPPCPCNPEGKVFPACEGWAARHTTGVTHAWHRPCETPYAIEELAFVGRVK